MASRYATASGNWSNPAIWDGGVAIPAAGDTVRPNTFTVTIDQNLTGATYDLRNDAGAPAAAGGSFAVSSIPGGGRTINANITRGASTNCLVVSATSGTLTLTGNIATDTNVNAGQALSVSGAGCTVNVTGTVNGGSGTGSTTNSVDGIGVSAVATLNVTGNVTGGSTSGAGAQNGIDVTAAATVTVTGNVTGGPGGANCAGIRIAADATVTINGNVTGSATSTPHGIDVTSTTWNGDLIINGDTTASATAAAVLVSTTTSTTGSVDFNGDVTAATGFHGAQFTTGAVLVRSQGVVTDASNGRIGLYAPFVVFPALPAKSTVVKRGDAGFPSIGNPVTLTNFEDNGLPDPTDVRRGTVYGPDDTLEGTRYPALTAADVWDYLLADLDTVGSIGAYLKNAATHPVVAALLAAAMNDNS